MPTPSPSIPNPLGAMEHPRELSRRGFFNRAADGIYGAALASLLSGGRPCIDIMVRVVASRWRILRYVPFLDILPLRLDVAKMHGAVFIGPAVQLLVLGHGCKAHQQANSCHDEHVNR